MFQPRTKIFRLLSQKGRGREERRGIGRGQMEKRDGKEGREGGGERWEKGMKRENKRDG